MAKTVKQAAAAVQFFVGWQVGGKLQVICLRMAVHFTDHSFPIKTWTFNYCLFF